MYSYNRRIYILRNDAQGNSGILTVGRRARLYVAIAHVHARKREIKPPAISIKNIIDIRECSTNSMHVSYLRHEIK